jgi:arylsulfatase A-like enzyme
VQGRSSGGVVLRWTGAAALCLCLAVGPGSARASADARPSVLLVVIDTLRADAVSVYGAVEGTTPTMDALAAQGLLFRRAYAPAPWTLPSHATIFSGLRVDQHGVGMPGRAVLPESVVTLAERMQAAGYQTAVIAENVIINDSLQLLQGFEHRRAPRWRKVGLLEDAGRPFELREIDALSEVREWLPKRDFSRPFFLFVNLFDPHAPYTIRDENPFVPAGALEADIKSRSPRPNRLLCGGLPSPQQLAVLRGLYLGDVAAADLELGEIAKLVRERGGASELITIATSDHGEFLGERKLMGHEFSLQAAALHVPLIVHGLAGVQPSAIEHPVGLMDIVPSILRWAGIEAPPELPGRPLPQTPDAAPSGERSLFAAYSDQYMQVSEFWDEGAQRGHEKRRQFCGPLDRVFGGMATLTRYPFKFYWFERYSPELYDLSWDPNELSNQSKYRPELVERFASEVESYVDAAGLTGSQPTQPEEMPEEAIEALRELGYID